MNKDFENKLNQWYGNYMKDYRIIKETEQDIILLVESSSFFEITRIFYVGNSVEISIDTRQKGINIDTIENLICTLLKVI